MPSFIMPKGENMDLIKRPKKVQRAEKGYLDEKKYQDYAESQFKNIYDKTDEIIGEMKKISNTYSTEETLTRETWIDGKPIYRKVLYGQTTSEESIEIDLSNDVATVIRVEGFIEAIDGLATIIPSYWNEYLKVITQIRLPKIYLTYGANFKNCNYVYVLEYTKTTD